MPAIKAIVFDSDGTLMNSFDFIMESYRHLARVFGYPEPSETEVRAQLQLSTPLPQIMQGFCPGAPIGKLLSEFTAFHTANAHTIGAFDGVDELLAALQARGLRLAVVTGGNGHVEEVLARAGLREYFTSIVHCDRVQFGKPNPEGFELALEECGVLPAEAIMVGDSPNDILAGKNGRAATTIGIMHGHGTRADLMAADADYIVADVPDLAGRLMELVSDR